jgi:hypothetical protein
MPATAARTVTRLFAPLCAAALTLGVGPAGVAQSGNPFDDSSPQGGNGVSTPTGNPFDTGAVGQPQAQPGQARSGPTLFVEHQITDPGMNNIVASTVLAPEGWTREGGLTRPHPRYFSMAYLSDVSFKAPDGRGARFMPSLNFEFGSPQQQAQLLSPTQSGRMYFPLPQSPGQWILQMAQMNPDPQVQNLRLVHEEPIPELTQQLRQQNAEMYRMMQQMERQNQMYGGSGLAYRMHYDTQATKIVLQYTENGMELEETVLMTWWYLLTSINGQSYGGTWSIGMMRSARGPVGTDYLHDPQVMAIFKSVRANPVWVNEMNKHYAAMARIQAKGNADRQRSWAAHNRKMQQINSETNDIINSGWHERQAIQERGAERFNDTIRDETAYATPDGEKVKLPSFYNHAYSDGNGRYILTDDHFYNPAADPNLTGNWQPLQEIR